MIGRLQIGKSVVSLAPKFWAIVIGVIPCQGAHFTFSNFYCVKRSFLFSGVKISSSAWFRSSGSELEYGWSLFWVVSSLSPRKKHPPARESALLWIVATSRASNAVFGWVWPMTTRPTPPKRLDDLGRPPIGSESRVDSFHVEASTACIWLDVPEVCGADRGVRCESLFGARSWRSSIRICCEWIIGMTPKSRKVAKSEDN